MAGIYIHIPFCKQRCSYCDFFSSTDIRNMEKDYATAVCDELSHRKDYLQGQPIDTVFFGGGTPSDLSLESLLTITLILYYIYGIDKNREISIEVNPDDLTSYKIQEYKDYLFNRFSLGVQSFNDRELKLLNRRHNAKKAIQAIDRLKKRGCENINIDLIYGLPGQGMRTWKNTIRKAIDLQVQHISAYHLTYEKGTPLYNQLKEGNLTPVDEKMSRRMFEVLTDMLEDAGFEHYEISNFARPGFECRHNISYWNGTHYLGIGASAHSYNGVSRQWNAKTLTPDYLTSGFEVEVLDEKMKYNDFIITRLRMMKGMDLNELTTLFGESRKTYCLRQAEKHLTDGLLQLEDNRLRLTRKGMFVSDGIMRDLIR